MPMIRTALVVLTLLVFFAPSADAQAVAFAPVIGSAPDGVFLPVTPVVTADRRYVRLSLSPMFFGFDHFDTFIVPAAVGGGGAGGLGGGGLGGLGGGGLGGLGGGGAGGGGGNVGGRAVVGGGGVAVGMDEFGNFLPAPGFAGQSPEFGYGSASFPTALPRGNYRNRQGTLTARATPARNAPVANRTARTRARTAKTRRPAPTAKTTDEAKATTTAASSAKPR